MGDLQAFHRQLGFTNDAFTHLILSHRPINEAQKASIALALARSVPTALNCISLNRFLAANGPPTTFLECFAAIARILAHKDADSIDSDSAADGDTESVVPDEILRSFKFSAPPTPTGQAGAHPCQIMPPTPTKPPSSASPVPPVATQQAQDTPTKGGSGSSTTLSPDLYAEAHLTGAAAKRTGLRKHLSKSRLQIKKLIAKGPRKGDAGSWWNATAAAPQPAQQQLEPIKSIATELAAVSAKTAEDKKAAILAHFARDNGTPVRRHSHVARPHLSPADVETRRARRRTLPPQLHDSVPSSPELERSATPSIIPVQTRQRLLSMPPVPPRPAMTMLSTPGEAAARQRLMNLHIGGPHFSSPPPVQHGFTSLDQLVLQDSLEPTKIRASQAQARSKALAALEASSAIQTARDREASDARAHEQMLAHLHRLKDQTEAFAEDTRFGVVKKDKGSKAQTRNYEIQHVGDGYGLNGYGGQRRVGATHAKREVRKRTPSRVPVIVFGDASGTGSDFSVDETDLVL